VGAAGVWTVLHALTAARDGPIDSVRTDSRGEYAFRIAQADTAATYLVSVRHDGIAYFAPAFHANGPRLRLPLVSVYDTSSVAPPVRFAERHVVIRPPSGDGSRQALELLVLENDGTRTRVAAPDRPVWRGRIAGGAVEAEVRASDFSEEAVTVGDDGTVTVTGPVPPGQRQVLVQYVLPRTIRRLDVTPPDSSTRLDVLLADSGVTIADSALPFGGLENLGGEAYRRYTSSAGVIRPVVLQFAARSRGAMHLFAPLLAVAATIVLSLTLWWWWRGRGARPAPGAVIGVESPEALAAAIAALDREFAGRETDEYQLRRSALKARLVEALAAGRRAE
jgi:hypothetical protein